MKAYKNLIKYALKDGNVVSVNDGEEWAVKKSSKYTEIIEAIESVEEATIVIRNKDGEKIGWALIQPFGLEDDETVVDYTCSEYMEQWNNDYLEYQSQY